MPNLWIYSQGQGQVQVKSGQIKTLAAHSSLAALLLGECRARCDSVVALYGGTGQSSTPHRRLGRLVPIQRAQHEKKNTRRQQKRARANSGRVCIEWHVAAGGGKGAKRTFGTDGSRQALTSH